MEKNSTFKTLFKLIRTKANHRILTSQSHPANYLFLHKISEVNLVNYSLGFTSEIHSSSSLVTISTFYISGYINNSQC